MNFDIVAAFKRCVTIEFSGDEPFESVNERIVYVDGKEVLRTHRNVVTINDLHPNTLYTIRAVDDTGAEAVQTVTTKNESVLLNVKRFGAVGDGEHDDTNAIQAAIMACPEEGTVYLPKGTYYVRPLFLRSDMTLWVPEGSMILGDTDRTHYPILPGMTRCTNEVDEYPLGSWEGNPLDCFASLIMAIDCENVDIEGGGVFNGNADQSDWWTNWKVKRIAWRPNMMNFTRCENMRVVNVTIKNSPCWNIHPCYSNHLQYLNLRIENPYNSPNTDGFDPESCTDVLLLGTVISVGDDCIAIKAGKYYMATYHYACSDGYEIRNCRLEKGHGSVTVGSEIACGVQNVHVNKCVFSETDRGLRIKTRRGRGERSILTNLVFENITMDRVHMPLTVNMFYFCDPDGHSDYVQDQNPHPVDELTPSIGTIAIRNVKATNVMASFVCAYGLPEQPIGEIRLENVDASFAPAAERSAEVPIMMDNFEPMSGKSVYAHNVDRLIMNNVTIRGSEDSEPEMINVREFKADGLTYEA